MPFVLAHKDNIKVKVEFLVPGDLDQHTKADLAITYERMPAAELEELFKSEQLMIDVATEKLLNIEGLLDAQGRDMTFDRDQHLPALLKENYLRKALVDGFLKAQRIPEQQDAAAKNS